MRQKPQARSLYQAGANIWAKSIDLDKDSKNGVGSQDDVVGILEYTTKIPLGLKILLELKINK